MAAAVYHTEFQAQTQDLPVVEPTRWPQARR